MKNDDTNITRLAAVEICNTTLTGEDILPFMVEVKLEGENIDSAFLIVRETLTRIGIASNIQKNTLYQTCHILHKKGRYYIVHFKTMYVLDDRENNVSEGDIARQNKIIDLLETWGLVKVVDRAQMESPMSSMSKIRVVKSSERENWTLCPKYRIGERKEN